jgi:hypothetical protein
LAPKKSDNYDGREMYVRPQPDVRDPLYEQGYNDGFDQEPYRSDLGPNYREGYKIGLESLEEHRKEMDESGSSNA